MSLIIPAYDEEAVIERKSPMQGRSTIQPIVSRSCWPRTARATRQRRSPARRGQSRSWSCRASARWRRSTGPSPRRAGAILAFSDANSYWRPDALRRLVSRFADGRVGYVCGQVRFEGGEGGNQEGLYWRYEMAVRSRRPGWQGSPPGTGDLRGASRGLHRARPEPRPGHRLCLQLTKRGWRAVYEPGAVAEEKMAPTVEGEFRRKRRMMWGSGT